MFWILLVMTAFAEPEVSATLASDGYYTIRIVPDHGWKSAEMTVQGGETADLGPADKDAPLTVDGWTENRTLMRITLSAASNDGVGRTWMMEVEPFRVPAATPLLTPKPKPWPFRRDQQ
jgi:hypothetical protein